MSNDWFIFQGGQQQGPFTWEQLWHQARSGKISPSDQVWSQNLPGWTRADQVADLFPEARVPPPLQAPAAPLQGPYRGAPAKTGGKGGIIGLVILLVLLLGGGGAAGIFLLLRGGIPGLGSEEKKVIGSWGGLDTEEEILVQFLSDQTVKIAIRSQGMWSSTRYRLVKEDYRTYLEFYDETYQEWDRGAEISFQGKNTLVLTDTWDGSVLELSRINDRQFQEVINNLEFTEWY